MRLRPSVGVTAGQLVLRPQVLLAARLLKWESVAVQRRSNAELHSADTGSIDGRS